MEKEQIAQRTPDVTPEQWESVNEFNRNLVEEYLENQVALSPKTRKGYESGLHIFFYWVKKHLQDKKCVDIKKKDFIRYLNWLTNRGLSDSAIKFKKSTVSSFCNYVMTMYEDEYPTFRSFVTSEMKVVKTGYVHEKKPLTPEEYENLCNKLKELGEWEKLAYLEFSYSTGCRRAEARQLKKEVVNYEPDVKIITVRDEDGTEHEVESKSYKTHTIRCKGASLEGKQRKLKFSQEAMDALKKWVEVRGDDDCPYMFVIKEKDGSAKQVSESTFNEWCSGLFTRIVGRRVHPHLFRESRATNIVVYEHKSPKVAQKLLGHEDVSTTENHYIIKDSEDDESDEAFV